MNNHLTLSTSASKADRTHSATESEFIDFAEENFIRLHALNAKHGQPLSAATGEKLSRLEKLIHAVSGESR